VAALLAGGAFVAGVVVLQAVTRPGHKTQTTCPITGESIDPHTSLHVDWEGQRVYFATRAAADAFRKDPEAVFAKFASDDIAPENIQTACPVSGEELTGDNANGPTVNYKGRTIRLCCKKCPAEFELDPARYLAKLPGDQVAEK